MRYALLRLLLACAFLLAALPKLNGLGQFAEAVTHYHLLPAGAVPLFALTLPWLELICACLLILGFLTAGASLLLALASVLFFLATIYALMMGLDIQCGCYRGVSNLNWLTPAWDLVCLAASLVLFRCGPGLWALDSFLEEQNVAPDA